MEIITWALLGLFAGLIAKLIYPGDQGGGIFTTMSLGITGAVVGAYIGQNLGMGTHLASVLRAIAIILLWNKLQSYL